MQNKLSTEFLEDLYKKYHHRCFVHPDPLEFLYNYDNDFDREIVGLIASSLAYGRVNQILKSVSRVLEPMGKNPRAFLNDTKSLNLVYKDFKHRFTTGEEISKFLSGIKKVVNQYGSLQNCFAEKKEIYNFVKEIKRASGFKNDQNMTVLPDPEKGSSCKRLNLFLRWMVRSDKVDPGGWSNISASNLIVPLDTHMFQFSKKYGLTKRNAADLKTALEITNALKQFSPEDPIKYDFSITRIGIRGNNCPEEKI